MSRPNLGHFLNGNLRFSDFLRSKESVSSCSFSGHRIVFACREDWAAPRFESADEVP